MPGRYVGVLRSAEGPLAAAAPPPQAPSPATSSSATAPSWQYELCVSTGLPEIDLSHTLAQVFGDKWRTRISTFMGSHFRHAIFIQRLSLLTYFPLLLLPPSAYRDAVSVFALCALLSVSLTTVMLSLDVLQLLLCSHDYLFITAMNFLNWLTLAVVLGDLRGFPCLASWAATQVVISLDANIRTYPTVFRSMLLAVPSALSIAVLCSLDSLHDPSRLEIHIGMAKLPLANVLTYTASTLAIFMGKKVILKLWRSHTTFPGFNNIACVVLRAKMRLRCVQVTRRPPLPGLGLEAIHDATTSALPHVQKIFLSKLWLSKVDATECFLPPCFVLHVDDHQVDHDRPLSWWVLAPLYITGLLGYTSLIVKFALASFYHDLPSADNAQRVLSLIALPCTTVFCGALALHFQRDLMYALLANFDYLFSTYQVVAMSLCIADLADWDSTLSIAAFSWLMWYQLALTIDALTPLVKRRLRFRKRFIAPVLFALLVESIWIIRQVLTQKRDIFQRSRTLIKLSVSSQHTFRITTEQMLIERAVTILGWLGSRFVAELIFAQEDELMFIRGLVEYMSPYDTFPPKKTTRAQVAIVDLK